jgi:hypothetical protein
MVFGLGVGLLAILAGGLVFAFRADNSHRLVVFERAEYYFGSLFLSLLIGAVVGRLLRERMKWRYGAHIGVGVTLALEFAFLSPLIMGVR